MGIGRGFSASQLAIRGEITSRIVDEIKTTHRQRPLDLVLTYFYNSHFDPAGFEEIHGLGVTTVNFYCNSIHQFDLVSEIAPRARFAWHAEKHARELYLKVGANPIWVQMAADPQTYHPVEGCAREKKACFVGMRYADRDRWLAALIRDDVPLALYGPGWGGDAPAPSGAGAVANGQEPGRLRRYALEAMGNFHKHGPIGGLTRTWRQMVQVRESRRLSPLFPQVAKGAIPFEKIREAFSSHEVILNFSNVWADGRPGSALIPHVRLRDFEAPMCRTCFLSGYTDELADFYDIGTEIDAYRTEEELIDKVRFYLKHPEAAERLRQAGYERARRDHTWVRRFEQLLGAVMDRK